MRAIVIRYPKTKKLDVGVTGMKYKGMRWLKCDLQMQTPADSVHWAGEQMKSGEEAESAKLFAEACYEKRLDVVGITDHNFLSKDLIPHLKSAFSHIEEQFGHKIHLFPGFEFEAAGVGRGVHVLCLFEPDSDLALLDTILTECGITYPRISGGTLVKSDKNLKEILRIVQINHGGIVILPHATGSDGIFDNNNISDWLQKDQFTNPDLFAVEVPKPINRMSEAYQQLLLMGPNCQPGWKRIRPIATIMSSDNKKLVENNPDGKPSANSIGCRYTWIKMSTPCIESLRQAFLDHESRIILPQDVSDELNPSQRHSHPQIQSLSVKNVAFLADQEFHFSANMNCVIGGRGSGKSTLLEYLRIVFGKDGNKDIDPDTRGRIERIKDTLKANGAQLEACWKSAEGIEERVVWENGQLSVPDREMPDPDTFFNNLPIRIYSQHQVSRLTESKKEENSTRQADRLLDLVDAFTKKDLGELNERERKVKMQISDGFRDQRKIKTLEENLKRSRQNLQDLDRQLKARSEIQEEATRYQLLKAEAHYLEEILEAPNKQPSALEELANQISDSHTPFLIESSPNLTFLKKLDTIVKTAKQDLAQEIKASIERFNAKIQDVKEQDAWASIQLELEQADKNFLEACAQKGLSPDDVGRLHEISQARSDAQTGILDLEMEIEGIKEAAINPEELLPQLNEIWKIQYQKRRAASQRANELSTMAGSSQRFIEVSAKYQRDYKSFSEQWQAFAPPDGRTRLGRNWDTIGKRIYDRFETDELDSPWNVLSAWLLDENLIIADLGEDLYRDLFQYVQDNQESWEQLRMSRVQDIVDLKLFRSDGTLAGSIAEGTLSDGQRNTAALALLLAQDDGPLIIDQPEDELDSNFVFNELLPMLRRVKTHRQLIMATHNANLPVNGDAELVYALEAKNAQGKMLAQGGLDKTVVTKAILDIMEGTEEAFRRRREKYHF